MRSQTSGHRARLAILGWLGALDVAHFVWVRRYSLFQRSPGRAIGSVAGLGMWLALGGAATAAPGSALTRRLARAGGAGNLILYLIHLRVGKGRLRALPGAVLGVASLLSSRG
ncbi:MAG: hypothetical protein ACP5PW_01295 [Candidatus Dormibacteria bacterium]